MEENLNSHILKLLGASNPGPHRHAVRNRRCILIAFYKLDRNSQIQKVSFSVESETFLHSATLEAIALSGTWKASLVPVW